MSDTIRFKVVVLIAVVVDGRDDGAVRQSDVAVGVVPCLVLLLHPVAGNVQGGVVEGAGGDPVVAAPRRSGLSILELDIPFILLNGRCLFVDENLLLFYNLNIRSYYRPLSL